MKSNLKTRALRWAAPVALVGALGAAACGTGSDDSAEALVTERAGSASFPSAAAIERGAQLAERAESVSFPSVGAIERQAQLEGQARTHSKAASPVTPNWPSHTSLESQAESISGGDEFVPGSRHMPMR